MAQERSPNQAIRLRLVWDFIDRHIGRELHDKIVAMIPLVTLNALLKREHPYLIKVGGARSASEFIVAALDETLNLYEEVVLADFLKKIAGFVCKETHAGRKSRKSGIDLEFKRGKRYYVVTINADPHISAVHQQGIQANFARAIDGLSASGEIAKESIIAIECSYFGKEDVPRKLGYQRRCGQSFWKLLSGRDDLYRKLAAPLNTISQERRTKLIVQRAQKITLLTQEFSRRFSRNGLIQRDRLVKYCFKS